MSDVEQRTHDWHLAMFKSVLDAGNRASNTMLLVTGGASIALLALIGNLATNGVYFSLIASLGESLLWFCFCLISVLVNVGATYVSQHFYADSAYRDHDEKLRRAADVFKYLAILAYIAALVFFGTGAIHAYHALLEFRQV